MKDAIKFKELERIANSVEKFKEVYPHTNFYIETTLDWAAKVVNFNPRKCIYI